MSLFRHSNILLLLLLLYYYVTQADIYCSNKQDSLLFIYNICYNDLYCQILYGLDNHHDNNNNNIISSKSSILYKTNFKNFIYQIDKMGLLLSHINYNKGETLNNIYLSVWNNKWNSNSKKIIYYNLSYSITNCSDIDIVNDMSPDMMNIVINILYSLNMYKQIISTEEVCSDINERLLIDTENNIISCICREDRICGEDVSFNIFIKTISILILILVFISFIMVVVSSIMTIKKLNRIESKLNK